MSLTQQNVVHINCIQFPTTLQHEF